MVLKLLLRNCAASSSSESTSSRSKRLTSLYVYPGISSSFIGLQWQYNLILTAAKNKGKQLPLTRFFFLFFYHIFSTVDISFILWAVHFWLYDYVKMNFLTLSRYLCFRQFVSFQSTWLLYGRTNKFSQMNFWYWKRKLMKQIKLGSPMMNI